MNKVIYKYPFDIQASFSIRLPKGYQILNVEVQVGQPCMWVFVNPDNKSSNVRFLLYGTGHEVHKDVSLGNYEHIKTFQDLRKDCIPFVWHLFKNKGD